MTVFRDVADVAGVEPTFIQHFRSRFRLAVVTSHYVWPTNEDLTIFSDLDLDAVERNSDRTNMIIPGAICRHDARLCRTVALKNRYSRREVRIRQRRRKRRATRNEIAKPPTNSRAPLRKHELIGELLLHSEGRQNPFPLIFELAVFLTDLEGAHEDRLLHSLFGHPLLDDPVIYL